jgi:hypothetical protein
LNTITNVLKLNETIWKSTKRWNRLRGSQQIANATTKQINKFKEIKLSLFMNLNFIIVQNK